MPRLICPSCDTTIEIPEDRLGLSVECERCGAVFKAVEREQRGVRSRDDGEKESSFRADVPPPRESRRRRREEDDDFDDRFYDIRRGRRFDRSAALAKVQGPGTLLQVMGILLFLAAPLCVAGAVWAVSEVTNNAKKPNPLQPDNEDELILMIGCIFGAVCGFAAGPLLLAAGSRMKAFKSYGLAMTATIVLMSIGFLTCILLLAAGVWPLVALLDANVKEAFQREKERYEGVAYGG